jgi:two-component system, OmpR family, response regulator
MHILLVEDDAVLADGLAHTLRAAGYALDVLHAGDLADDALAVEEYDLVILDIELPALDGFEVLRRLRKRKRTTPVLILTARDALHDRVRGLDLGADDYLVKPFDMAELEARVRALVRRAQGVAENQLCVGRVTLDVPGRRVALDGRPLDLSAREIAVLEVLMGRVGRVVNKDTLMRSLYEWGDDVGPNAIEVYVHRIRKKLAESDVGIRTIRGLGYLLEPVEAGAPQSG